MNEETCATPALVGEVARQWRETAEPWLSADDLLARYRPLLDVLGVGREGRSLLRDLHLYGRGVPVEGVHCTGDILTRIWHCPELASWNRVKQSVDWGLCEMVGAAILRPARAWRSLPRPLGARMSAGRGGEGETGGLVRGVGRGDGGGGARGLRGSPRPRTAAPVDGSGRLGSWSEARAVARGEKPLPPCLATL